jgi:hypothetical protein
VGLKRPEPQAARNAAIEGNAQRSEVREMRSLVRTVFCLILWLLVVRTSAVAQSADDEFFRRWVDYCDGAISVAFAQVPVEFAVHAIHARTGFQMVVPREAYGRTLNLRLRELPLESAMRSFIFSIGFTSFAFTYDKSGRPVRAIILEAPPAPADSPVREPQPLTPAEKDEISAS